jgi:hypothetical protein
VIKCNKENGIHNTWFTPSKNHDAILTPNKKGVQATTCNPLLKLVGGGGIERSTSGM